LSTTRAEADVLEATAKKFETVNQNLSDMLKRLMSELEVLESQWRGMGGTAFTSVKQRWAADQAALYEALSYTAEAIRSSGGNYQSTDTSASSRINAAGGGGGQTLPL
jgi:WXG100 family type VII secretion target